MPRQSFRKHVAQLDRATAAYLGAAEGRSGVAVGAGFIGVVPIMRRFGRRLQTLVTLAAKGEFSTITSYLRKFLWSDERCVILRRDLSQTIVHPKAPVTFSIRSYEPRDAAVLFDAASPVGRAQQTILEIWMERRKGCYVAALDDGRAIFKQCISTPSDNAYADVEPGTVLLEGAYTPPRFRRLGVMPAAMARLAEEGRRFGERWALVCVGETNTSMIKAAQLAGFTLFRLASRRRRLFRLFVTYSELPTEFGPRGR